MQLVEDKIADRRFTNLMRKALKAGYFEFRAYKSNIIATSQGSIVSPILANIYLDQLDEFVLSMKSDFDREGATKISRYYEYLKGERNKKLRELIAQRSKSAIDFASDEYKRLSYVRYADD
jgi:retron-type reverse transcriptase